MTDREQIRIDLKRQLNSYRDLLAERAHLEEELQRLDALSVSGPNLDGMPRGGSGPSNPTESIALKRLALVNRYNEQIAKIVEQHTAIEDLIEGLEPTERRLARLRYIDGLTWEEVCYHINYSWMQTHRIHGRILDKLVEAELKKKETSE